MRRNAAHRVHRNGTTDHLGVFAAVRIRPALRQADCLIEGDVGKFACDAAYRLRIHAALRRNGFRRVVVGKEAFGEQLECRNRDTSIVKGELASHTG